MADTLPRLELLDEANQSAAEVILHYLYGGTDLSRDYFSR